MYKNKIFSYDIFGLFISSYFQQPASEDMVEIIILHNDFMYVLFGIIILILWVMMFSIYNSIKNYG